MDALANKKAMKTSYDLTDGRANRSELGESMDMDEKTVDAVFRYLSQEGLVKRIGTGPFAITDADMVDVEEALSHPQRAREPRTYPELGWGCRASMVGFADAQTTEAHTPGASGCVTRDA